jgi:hypothetical protein
MTNKVAKMDAKEWFKERLLENNFNISLLLKKNHLKYDQDITLIPNEVIERQNYRGFRKDVTRILASTICEYVNEFGAILRKDIDDCVIEQINSQQEIKYSEARSNFFIKSIIASHTEFNGLIYRKGIKKKRRGINRLGIGKDYNINFQNAARYNYCSLFYKDEDTAREYLFNKFGKVKRLSNIYNLVPKKIKNEININQKGNDELLEEKVDSVKSMEDMSLKEVLGFESNVEYKRWIKERDELFKENGNGWWYNPEGRSVKKKSSSKK